uniref:DDE Tnp4 domain-containing protein n=1 Tax=Labrus bergylta TaxID=56723 RepID=A0A3Q3ECV4_9LABR
MCSISEAACFSKCLSFHQLLSDTISEIKKTSEIGKQFSLWKHKFRQLKNLVPTQYLRLSRQTVKALLECLVYSKDHGWNKDLEVGIYFYWLASATSYRVVSTGLVFGVSKTMVCPCVQDFCKAVCMLLVPEQICFPDWDKLKDMAAYIENRWVLPQCTDATGGSHIPIIAPQGYHCDYFNRKVWHSIILQGVVDGKGLSCSVNAGLPGSMHDASVLRLSTLWENVGGVNVGYYILGDSAYPLQNWLLKPFSNNGCLTAEQMMGGGVIKRTTRMNGTPVSAELVVALATVDREGGQRCT